MIDIKLIRENGDQIKKALEKRNYRVDFTPLLEWDRERRTLISESDKLKECRNTVSSEIPVLKKKGEDVSALIKEMKEVSNQIKDYDKKIADFSGKINDFLVSLPNIPAPDVPAGGKENNQVVREGGEKPAFAFKVKDHVSLVSSLGLVDYERGVKLGGNGFWLYSGIGAQLEWALINYFIREHLKDRYVFVLPPHILSYECGFTAGQFPKFKGDVFHLETEKEGESFRFLLPTAETAIINLHRNEVLKESELPKKYFSYTPCYRKEAGSYRTGERGMIRGHQFNKVEMFQYTRPEDSEAAQEELLIKAERLVKGLGLHYRVTKLAAADCSSVMLKTFDVEVWIPSMNEYKEVSSISNAGDYQARRGNIRFKRESTGKNEYVHSLNASGLATSRLLPAICEQNQQPDGSVILPEVLSREVGFEMIAPATP
jgi:seryl-tRNA synthetase